MTDKRLKVKLEEVIDAMYGANPETEYFYYTKTEEIFMVLNGAAMGDNNDEALEDMEENFQDYISLPNQRDIDEYSMMENFIAKLSDLDVQGELEIVIRGTGAFRRFKDTICRLDLRQEWYDFRDNAFKKIALEWCEEHLLETIE